MARKTTPPAKGVSGKKAKKKRPGQYERTPKQRKAASERVKQHRAETPPTPAQQAASAENGKEGGQPTKYLPEYCERLKAYFNVDPTTILTKTIETKKGDIITVEERVGIDFPTLQGFAREINVSHRTLLEWAKVHPEFKEALEFGKTCQEHTLLVNGMHGHYMQPLTVLFAKNNMGYREKIALTDEEGGAVKAEVTLKDELDKRRAAVREKLAKQAAAAAARAAG